MRGRRDSAAPSLDSRVGSDASASSSASPRPDDAADRVPGLAEALAGGKPLDTADAHVGLLLAGPEEIAWDVCRRVQTALLRRALARNVGHSPDKRDTDAMLGILVEAADQLGHGPTADEFNENNTACPWWTAATIARAFGSWRHALAKAGLLSPVETAAVLSRKPNWRSGKKLPRFSDSRLIETLRWCSRAIHGGRHDYVSIRAFLDWRGTELVAAGRRGEELSLPSRHQFAKLGSWPEANRRAGLTHASGASATPDRTRP